jgi:hypothetical protein
MFAVFGFQAHQTHRDIRMPEGALREIQATATYRAERVIEDLRLVDSRRSEAKTAVELKSGHVLQGTQPIGGSGDLKHTGDCLCRVGARLCVA